RFDLSDIPAGPRGMPQIEVTFDIEAKMYAEQAAAGAGPEAAAQGGAAEEPAGAADDNVVDAEFEEVKDDKK
ncbi:Hsp70 family protein, partial [Oleiphilus sp. HI0061]|uniref:Hsp70 family protein n=1 Tax=Oleiphilus sp. HI0061 TaxID=1822239 RepID=UPI000A7580CF